MNDQGFPKAGFRNPLPNPFVPKFPLQGLSFATVCRMSLVSRELARSVLSAGRLEQWRMVRSALVSYFEACRRVLRLPTISGGKGGASLGVIGACTSPPGLRLRFPRDARRGSS